MTRIIQFSLLVAALIPAALARADSPVGVYTSIPWGFHTNSWFIEGPEGVVLVGTQFLSSAALAAVETAEKQTGKKVVLALVLHPNPDKFNGTAALQARGIRVVTSDQVLAEIPAVHALRKRWFFERYQPDYPAAQPKPESFGSESTLLRAGGLTLKAHVLGRGTSAAHVVLEHQGHVFVGDLVSNWSHAWLELGFLSEWLDRLDDIARLNPSHVHPGRGPAAGATLIDVQRTYLKFVLDTARSLAPSGTTDAATLARIRDRIVAEYPGFDYRIFVELGLPAVVARTGSPGPARSASDAID